MNEKVSGRQLAKILDYAPSYISKLKTQGVFTTAYDETEKKFDPEKAVKDIEASQDPEKEYVRQRWEKYRAGDLNTSLENSVDNLEVTGGDDAAGASKEQQSEKVSPGNAEGVGGGDAARGSPSTGAGGDINVVSFQDAKTKKEIYLAKSAELAFEKAAGNLVDRVVVEKAAAACACLVRESLSNIPDRLSQVLAAETGPVKIHEHLSEEFKKILNELSNQIDRTLGARHT